MTPSTIGPKAWVLQQYSPEELRDIAEHGCAALVAQNATEG